MSRIQIPLDALTSRLNLGDRLSSLRSGSIANRFSNLRPVGEFFDIKRISKPANFGEVQSRVNYNLSYFSSNYSAVFVMLAIYALLSNIWLLFDIAFVMGGTYIIGKLEGRDLELGQQRFTTSQLYTGLYCIAIPIGIIASPWNTALWLIGASGVVILGHAAFMDKPIDEAFSGEATIEARAQKICGCAQRERRRTRGDDDTDTQGVGLVSTRAGGGHRFVSDPLRFTGIDLGDRDGARPRRNYSHGSDDEDSDDSSDNDSEESSDDEEILEIAMARIRRAQAKGKKDVKLSQEELKAIERQRQRMQNGGQKKKKEQRFAVPLSHLEPTSRKRIDAAPAGTENSPPPEAGEAQHAQHRGYPPMGYFPPPSASRPPRPRERSGTTSSRPSSRSAVDREQSSSPFSYSYVQRGDHAASVRHSSDPAAGQPRSRGSVYGEPGPMDNAVGSYPSSSLPGQFDPFQYMTGGPRTSYPGVATSSPATRQSVSGSPRTSVPSPRTQPPPGPGPSAAVVNARRVSNRTEESSSEEETSSEEEDDEEVVVVSAKRTSSAEKPGARIVTAAPPAAASSPAPGPVTRERERIERMREAELSREVSPPVQTLRRSPTKQGSSSTSRKPVGGTTSSSSRRRKK
ncbi:COPII vesicles protein Yip3 [Naviculisporaceae sp. PSN 640]